MDGISTSMQMTSHKRVAYEDSNFKFEIELVGDMAGLHCVVTHWSPSVLKHMYKVFVETQNLLADNGFKRMVTISPNPKFAKLFGGDTIESLDKDGIRYEVIVWELK